MDELLDLVEKNITVIKSTIERNKKYHDYPFTNNCDHYYTLILLQNRLDNWESFSKIILRFKNSRCTPVSKKSDRFEKMITVERNGVPGYITRKTVNESLRPLTRLPLCCHSSLGGRGGMWCRVLTHHEQNQKNGLISEKWSRI
jgi:hypothetical protein